MCKTPNIPLNNHANPYTHTRMHAWGKKMTDIITHLKEYFVCFEKWEDNLPIKVFTMGEKYIIRVVIISFSLSQKKV